MPKKKEQKRRNKMKDKENIRDWWIIKTEENLKKERPKKIGKFKK